MSSAVVRCPECMGASRVDPAALGLTVRCPRCDATFEAVEEAEIAIPARPSRNPMLLPALPAPRSRRRSRPDPIPSPRDEFDPARASAPATVGSEHDPHQEQPEGPLPASVLIGLALLPFIIPILWLLGPAAFGEKPVLSVATPLALAVAASVLCLAVIYTIDWTPATRIKGVLMLVGLAYFTGAGLFFLKQKLIERIERELRSGTDSMVFQPLDAEAKFQVRMPVRPDKVQGLQPLPPVRLNCYRAVSKPPVSQVTFVAGSAKVPDKAVGPAPGTGAWFDATVERIADEAGGMLRAPARPVTHQEIFQGRELEIALAGEAVRIVRVFVVEKKGIYYLAVEGAGIGAEDEVVKEYFESFFVPGARD